MRPNQTSRDALTLDILPAMNGRDSYGVPAGFAGISSVGSSHNRLTSAEDYEETLLSGYPPVGLLDGKNVYHAEQKGNRLPRLPVLPHAPDARSPGRSSRGKA